jgi:HEAT repeat protein
MRWIELEDDEYLELERGEDIDLVSDQFYEALESDPSELMTRLEDIQGREATLLLRSTRVLEQIKHREGNISLRDDEAVEAIADFIEHINDQVGETSNSGTSLRFQFTTNAGLANERGLDIPGWRSAIAAWEAIRTKQLTLDVESQALDEIKRILLEKRRPSGFNKATWKAFTKYVRKNNGRNLPELIGNFQWVTGALAADKVSTEIERRLIEKNWAIDTRQASERYGRLYLYVSRLLTQRGTKKLTQNELFTELRKLSLTDEERIALDNIRRVTEYVLRKIQEHEARIASIEGDVADIDARVGKIEGTQAFVKPTLDQLRGACSKITGQWLKDMRRLATSTPRRALEVELEAFLESASHYCVLLGPSGVGKSTIMGLESQHLQEQGWTVLMVYGSQFELQHLAQLIVRVGLQQQGTIDWWHVLIEPWAAELPPDTRGFVLMIDALDEPDSQRISEELLTLHQAIAELPDRNVKVIVSCHAPTWEDISQQLPFWRTNTTSAATGLTAEGLVEISVPDFTDEELDVALQSLPANYLVTARLPGQETDPHVEALRNLLKHPASFGLYADLYERGEDVQSVTWSGLAEHYVEATLERVAHRCKLSNDSLREDLIKLTRIAWEQKVGDFFIGIDTVRAEFPHWNVQQTEPSSSAYAALAESGALVKRSSTAAKQQIGFGHPDIARYLLSLEVERRLEGKSTNEVREIATEYLDNIHNYVPLLDAILALLNRLAVNTTEPGEMELTIIDTIMMEGHHVRFEVFFRRMQPRVLKDIFTLLGRNKPDYVEPYRTAARAIRPTAEALSEIRRHLHDHDGHRRDLAVQLAGEHRDSTSIPRLVELLQDDDNAVQMPVYRALLQMGTVALATLLDVIRDISRSIALRGLCLGLVRDIGHKNDEVAATVKACIEEQYQDATISDYSLLRIALSTAQRLRLVDNKPHAVRALSNPDWQVVDQAADFLVEFPEPSAFPTLHDAYLAWKTADIEGIFRHFLLRSLLLAIAATEKQGSIDEVLQEVKLALDGKSTLTELEAIWLCSALHSPEAQAVIFSDLVQKLEAGQGDDLITRYLDAMAETWDVGLQGVFVSETARLAGSGTDFPKMLAETFIRAVKKKGDTLLRSDSRTQSTAVTALAKCQPSSFATMATRMLKYASRYTRYHIYEALWVLGDKRSESGLLRRLESHQPYIENGLDYEKHLMVRAIGTCGTKKGAKVLLNYLRTEPLILRQLPYECILPMVRRGYLAPDQLVELVTDSSASSQGRASCLITLCEIDAPKYIELFREMAHQDEDINIQGYSVSILGVTGDNDASTDLRLVLNKTSEASVAGRAALALGALNAREAVYDIEIALRKWADTTRADSFISVLGKLNAHSSLSILLNMLKEAKYWHLRSHIVEALGSFWNDANARKAVIEVLVNPVGYEGPNVQYSAVRTLLKHDPRYLLERCIELYSAGQLTERARVLLARDIPVLASTSRVDHKIVFELMQLLACDVKHSIRDEFGLTLRKLNPELAHHLYETLWSTGEPRTQACAIHTLAYWNSDTTLIERALDAVDLVVRNAARTALAKRKKRAMLQPVVQQFRSERGIERLVGYLSLKEYIDEQTLRELWEETPFKSPQRAFLDQLEQGARRHIEAELKKQRGDEESMTVA